MKKFIKENLIQLILIGILIILMILLSIRRKKNNENMINNLNYFIHMVVENSYAKGQADAINGDIRIKQIDDTTWIYIKSPWDSIKSSINDTIIIKR